MGVGERLMTNAGQLATLLPGANAFPGKSGKTGAQGLRGIPAPFPRHHAHHV